MPKELFGTDGIRGRAGEFPLDPRTAHAVGAALGRWAACHSGSPEVVIGMDTRESGPWLAGQVAGGLARHGVAARFAGLVTTPGVAWVTRTGPFVAGVMISASHNPYQDNGLKVFDHSGFKLPDSAEHELETEIFALLDSGLAAQALPLAVDPGLDSAYIDSLAETFRASLSGISLVVDCANGASSFLAPELFERLGAHVRAIHCQPDGRNINRDCGSLHLGSLVEQVRESRADAGVAFDGDADRVMFVSRSGKVLDGDAALLIAARSMFQQGRLHGQDGRPEVVATVMSNLGLEKALARHGISMLRTPVGDKYVLEEMVRRGANLGGEQSGHVIFRDFATTGDGLLTALRVFEIAARAGFDLDALSSELVVYPQLLVNVKVSRKRPLEELERVQQEIRAARDAFRDSGRVVVRFSGTEPLARVMLEGPDQESVRHYTQRIADAIRTELGQQ